MLSPGIGTNRMRWRIIFPGEVNKCTRTIQPSIMSNVFFSPVLVMLVPHFDYILFSRFLSS
jgi:hypothetical protein